MKDGRPDACIVVVAYQSVGTIGATLDPLREGCANGKTQVVVVDNASSDGTADFVEASYPWATLVRSLSNLGFGQGCNLGAGYSNARHVLFLNPDAVITQDAVEVLVAFLDGNPRVGIAGPAVIEASGRLQPAGALPSPLNIIAKPLFPRWAGREMRHVEPGEAPRRTNWVCGSIMIIRREVLEQVGGFDPRFFLYFEESDLCRRAQHAGWEIWTVGEAVCTHVNAASAKKMNAPLMWGGIPEHYFRSRLYYLKKHHGWISAVAAELGELVSMLARTMIDVVRGRRYGQLRPRLAAPILKLPARTAADDLAPLLDRPDEARGG